MATTASFMTGAISSEATRMRPSLFVRVARRVPLRSTTIEFSARSYCARFSSFGRSWATAIMIPKIQETRASTPRPRITRAARSFFSRGFVWVGSSPPPPGIT